MRAFSLLALGFVISACGSDKPKPKAPEGANTDGTSTKSVVAKPKPNLPEKAPDSPTASAVHISDEIRQMCGIDDAEAYFAFDSAKLDGRESRALEKVAECFEKGPLKGKIVRLVGHADPRGTSDYNMTLGQSRADAVKGFLSGKMDKAKVETTTRGAMDATGTDEPSWARDRRVDVLLAK